MKTNNHLKWLCLCCAFLSSLSLFAAPPLLDITTGIDGAANTVKEYSPMFQTLS